MEVLMPNSKKSQVNLEEMARTTLKWFITIVILCLLSCYTVVKKPSKISFDANNKMEPAPLQYQLKTNGKNTVKIIELATWRTGSSFLGELISLHKETFYSYEPLHLFSDNVR